MDREDYNQERLGEIDIFQQKVNQEGHEFFCNILNNNWFNQLRDGASKVWLGHAEEYNCKFFPFRWLFEEEEWDFINEWFVHFVSKTNKQQILKNKMNRLVSDDWMQAMTTALEIKAYCCFTRDQVFVELDPKINDHSDKNADSLIRINSRDVLVELTACTKSLVNPLTKSGSLPVDKKMKYQIISKIKTKANKQLVNADKPTVLVIALPPSIGADHYSAKWAIDECIMDYPQISAIIISDSYLFKYGAYYFNNYAKHPLNNEEKIYISKLIKLNRIVTKNPRVFGVFQEGI